ncbi:SHOCT domain-containing protein [Weissella viridescens]|uniref:SHOCT domain-containing protein n=1 Tax=Weissella viridescens TaxID=1629 RepID=UPI004057B032
MDNIEKLKELKILFDEGILTQQEFDDEKAKIVGIPVAKEVTSETVTDELEVGAEAEPVSQSASMIETEIKISENATTVEPEINQSETNVTGNALAARLQELTDLHDNQLITDTEYQRMRAEALGQTPSNATNIAKPKMPEMNLKSNKKLLTIGGGIVAALLVFVIFGFATQTTQEKLSKQVASDVTKKDSKALLKKFSPEDQKAEWALPGVSTLIYNWRDTNTTSIVSDLAAGQNINSDDDWANVKVTVQNKPHMFFWKTYYLDAQPIKVNAETGKDNYVVLTGTGDSDNLSDMDERAKKNAEKKVAVKDLEKNGVFPGWWVFNIEDKSGNRISSDAYMRSYGRSGNGNISMEFN